VTAHLMVNVHRPDAVAASLNCIEWLQKHDVDVAVDALAAAETGAPIVHNEDFGECDLVISFGGDGTLIRAAHLCSRRGTPILGVYYGRFGFVTQCSPSELGAALSQFLDGRSVIEPRMMLQVELIRGEKVLSTTHALNELAVQREPDARMLDFNISVDGQFLTRYPADGVVVATPTGSTAYNLSSGGPIVDPRLKAMLLTAIAPHTLSTRALVFSAESEIRIQVESRGESMLSCDSQGRIEMSSGDVIRITQSPRVTNLVTVDARDFLTKLSDRLLWGRPE
jgi:NAD+ kinase